MTNVADMLLVLCKTCIYLVAIKGCGAKDLKSFDREIKPLMGFLINIYAVI